MYPSPRHWAQLLLFSRAPPVSLPTQTVPRGCFLVELLSSINGTCLSFPSSPPRAVYGGSSKIMPSLAFPNSLDKAVLACSRCVSYFEEQIVSLLFTLDPTYILLRGSTFSSLFSFFLSNDHQRPGAPDYIIISATRDLGLGHLEFLPRTHLGAFSIHTFLAFYLRHCWFTPWRSPKKDLCISFIHSSSRTAVSILCLSLYLARQPERRRTRLSDPQPQLPSLKIHTPSAFHRKWPCSQYFTSRSPR